MIFHDFSMIFPRIVNPINIRKWCLLEQKLCGEMLGHSEDTGEMVKRGPRWFLPTEADAPLNRNKSGDFNTRFDPRLMVRET